MNKEMRLKEAIRNDINCFILDSGDILDIPDILREIADIYEEKINEEIDD